MTVVLISPDYLSHYRPLSVLGRAVGHRGERVVVATGDALRQRVEADGFEWRHLRLGPASNPGVVAADDPSIQDFLAATLDGPAATIAFQARKRRRDLLWEPVQVADDVGRILDDLDPEHVVVDHVSFASTLAMHAIGRPFVTLVPGHPTQLPVGAERYGLPPRWPVAVRPSAHDLAALELLLDGVARGFTDHWNDALLAIEPTATPVEDAYRIRGQRVLHNAVAGLQDAERMGALAADAGSDHHIVGPLVAAPPCADGPEPGPWGMAPRRRPRVYVAFGTFLANRGDVLARVAAALRRVGAQAAIAIGPTPADRLGPVPDDWVVAPTLPQIDLLAGADVAISHGGNNSVQEALAAGCRQIILPFSTDQFATAADVEQRGGGVVLAPNEASTDDLAQGVSVVLDRPAPERVPRLEPAALAAALLD